MTLPMLLFGQKHRVLPIINFGESFKRPTGDLGFAADTILGGNKLFGGEPDNTVDGYYKRSSQKKVVDVILGPGHGIVSATDPDRK